MRKCRSLFKISRERERESTLSINGCLADKLFTYIGIGVGAFLLLLLIVGAPIGWYLVRSFSYVACVDARSQWRRNKKKKAKKAKEALENTNTAYDTNVWV